MDLGSRIQNGQTYQMPQPHYDWYKKDTVQAEYSISNNDVSRIQIACLLKDKKDIVIDGNGALLMFHDRITPFLLDSCENVCLRNFTIDYERTFYTQGRILSADKNCVELLVDEEYPCEVRDGDLIMKGECWESNLKECFVLLQEFDPATGGLAYSSPVTACHIGKDAVSDPNSPLPMQLYTAEKDGNILRLRGEFPYLYQAGNVLIITHEDRMNGGIVLCNCRNITLENIHIIHTGAMGIVAQLSSDIMIRGVRVDTGGHKNRMVSTNCDATHFIGCSGQISIIDSVLESMMDDGVNVHGVYTMVSQPVDGHTLKTKIMHFQQEGVLFYRKDDKVAVYCGHSVEERAVLTVDEAVMEERGIIRIRFREEIEAVRTGDFLENLTTVPDLYIKGLHTGKNRPRGVLATTCGKVIIEDSLFYNSGYGIHIAGDTQFWYESGAVRDVLIRNNRFIDCGYNMGDYSIAITPEYEKTEKQKWYHKGIRIENNVFETFTDGIVYAYGVKGIRISGNTCRRTDHYPKRADTGVISLQNCFDVECDAEWEDKEG